MKDDLFCFDKNLENQFASRQTDYSDKLKKARIMCIRGRYEQALNIAEEILDDDPENMGAYIEILRVHSDDFSIFEGEEIDKDIRAIEKLFPDIDNDEYIEFLRNKKKAISNKQETVVSNENKKNRNETETNIVNKTAQLNEKTIINNNAYVASSQENVTENSPVNQVATPKINEATAVVIIKNQEKYSSAELSEAKIALDFFANNGSASALNILGWVYLFGRCGYTQDRKKAFDYFTKSAQLDYPTAMCWLGDCYYFGYGCTCNYSLALEYYKNAADLGSAWGMRQVGYCYENGRGATKDLTKAIEFYKKGASLNDDDET